MWYYVIEDMCVKIKLELSKLIKNKDSMRSKELWCLELLIYVYIYSYNAQSPSRRKETESSKVQPLWGFL